jgi:hypothetical protein
MTVVTQSAQRCAAVGDSAGAEIVAILHPAESMDFVVTGVAVIISATAI